MKTSVSKYVAAAVGVCAVGAAGMVGFIYSGLFDFRATSPHYPVVTWALHQTYQSTMEQMTANIAVAADLESPAGVAAGAKLYAANCAVCHGAPGVPRHAIGAGIYLDAPSLLKATRKNRPNQVFFVAKYGIKMTGMPAFGKSYGDDDLWALAAFLHKERGVSAEDYAALVKVAP